jgi:hypothetical protein
MWYKQLVYYCFLLLLTLSVCVGCASKKDEVIVLTASEQIILLRTSNEILTASNRELKTSLRLLEKKLELYQETFGEVYENINPPYKSGESGMEVWNNTSATNPSWEQLVAFLKEDMTETISYWDSSPEFAYSKDQLRELGVPEDRWFGNFVCGDFAALIHNNAEIIGIKAAEVVIHSIGKDYGHALNAFVTTDRGLVFIDCTGNKEGSGHDKVCCIKKGKEVICLELQDNIPWDYEGFLQQKHLLEQYNQEVLEFKAELEKVGSNFEGKWHLHAWDYKKFKAWEQRLIELEKQLIPVFGTEDIVTKVEIYW